MMRRTQARHSLIYVPASNIVSAKRKMSLESLANELLIELFEYFPITDLFRAFNDLNARFNTLISFFIRSSQQLDCRSMSKNQLDFVCQHYLPSIIDHITALLLSDNDETPQQINRFFSHGLKLDQFIHLRSLTFYHLSSDELMKNIMMTWSNLPYLTHIKFSQCYFSYRENDVLHMMNSIWSLPKLTHCYLDIMFRWTFSLTLPTVISSSIESLSILNIACTPNQLTHLYQHTIRLRHLCVKVSADSGDALSSSTASSLISLKLQFRCYNSIDLITHTLKDLNNLRRLTVEILDIYIDGHQWKEIITNYLPKLKLFQLKMEFYFRDRVHTKQYVNDLLDSFQTSFWLEERQWFVRCHYHPQSSSNYICLYTLPYSFANFPRIEVDEYESICSDNNDEKWWSYDYVHTLNYRAPLTNNLLLHQPRFVNIRHLSLSLGLNTQFWSIVPTFIRLTSLEVSLHGRSDTAQFQLQTILDQAPYLNSLKFDSWRTLEMPSLELTSQSVRQLDVRESDRWYNNTECLQLIDSPLGKQCESLRINVSNRTSILELVTQMINLRSLNVRCEGDKHTEQQSTSKDELVHWLQQHLPSTCTITRHPRCVVDILLWIR